MDAEKTQTPGGPGSTGGSGPGDDRLGWYQRLADYAQTAYANRVGTFDRIDAKASAMAGFIAVAITLASIGSGAPSKDAAACDDVEALLVAAHVCYALAVVLLVIAFGYCLGALHPRQTRNPARVLEVRQRSQRAAGAHREAALLQDVVKTLQEAEEDWGARAEEKAKPLQMAMGVLGAAVVAGALGYLLRTSAAVIMGVR